MEKYLQNHSTKQNVFIIQYHSDRDQFVLLTSLSLDL